MARAPHPKLSKPKGKVSTKLPRAEREKVCITRPARSDRRVYSPSDLRRIYRYVMGSHGFAGATCAILEESGIQRYLEAMVGQISDLAECEGVPGADVVLDYLGEEAINRVEEELELPEGTARALAEGCEDDSGSMVTRTRALLALLILFYGVWRKIKLTRLYRFVLRRFIFLTLLFALLDQLESYVARLLPVLDLLAQIPDTLLEVCTDGEEQ